MRIRAGFEITYECPAPSPMLMMLNVHPSRRADLVTPDDLRVDREARISHYTDLFGNLCSRALLPAGRTTLSTDFIIEDSGRPDPVLSETQLAKVEDLPDEVLVYLLGSRYCETDKMSNLTWSLFGATPPTWERVQAIVDYAHQRIEFGYHHARCDRTAAEGHEERIGVCRDFAHLAVTLHEHSGPLLYRLSRGYRGTARSGSDGL